jgi:hypothetical protein
MPPRSEVIPASLVVSLTPPPFDDADAPAETVTSPAMIADMPVATSKVALPDPLADSAVINDNVPDGSSWVPVPEETETRPLLPLAPAAPLVIATVPLEEAVPLPDNISSDPPRLSDDEPDVATTLPPGESRPPLWPAEMSTSPPPDVVPGLAMPDEKAIAPVLLDSADVASPVRTVTSPLDAVPAAAAVSMLTRPLYPTPSPPVTIRIDPPVLSVESPPFTKMSLRASLPSPADTSTDPAVPLAVPVSSVIAPASRAPVAAPAWRVTVPLWPPEPLAPSVASDNVPLEPPALTPE